MKNIKRCQTTTQYPIYQPKKKTNTLHSLSQYITVKGFKKLVIVVLASINSLNLISFFLV